MSRRRTPFRLWLIHGVMCIHHIYIYIYISMYYYIPFHGLSLYIPPNPSVIFPPFSRVKKNTWHFFFFILPFEFVAHRFSLYSTSFFSLSPLGFFGQLASGLSRHFPFSHGYLLCIKPRPRQPPENSSSVCLFSACSVQMEDTLGVINDVNGGRGILWVMSGQVGGM